MSTTLAGISMNVLLIDDHPLILQALQTVIEGLGTEVRVTGASSAESARRWLAGPDRYDLALLDLQLPDADGFEVLRELRAEHPALPVVVVSASERKADVLRAIDLGAMGFVPKRSRTDTLLEALKLVLDGGIYLPPMRAADSDAPWAAGAVFARSPSAADAEDLALAVAPAYAPTVARLGLTPRQKDVLACLLQGRPNKLIARELNLSVETVKDHVAAVLRALNVTSRTQAVLAVGELARRDETPLGWRTGLR